MFQNTGQQSLPPAIVNIPYWENLDFTYTGAYIPCVSFANASSAPDGMMIGEVDSLGNGAYSFMFDGVPAKVDSYPFTILFTDNFGASMTQNYTFNVIDPGVTFSSDTLPDAIVNQPYSASIQISNYGDGAHMPSFSYSNTLPKGINLNTSIFQISSGVQTTFGIKVSFTGTPTVPGNYSIVLNLSPGNSYLDQMIDLNVIDPSTQTQTPTATTSNVKNVEPPVPTTPIHTEIITLAKQSSTSIQNTPKVSSSTSATSSISTISSTSQKQLSTTTSVSVHLFSYIRTFFDNILNSVLRWF